MSLVILMPVFNDWDSVKEVINRLDQTFASFPTSVQVVLADDGSTAPCPPGLGEGGYAALDGVSILTLKKNLGHQRALAIGLCYISEKIACDAVLVMDGDGEDKPEDALRIAEKLNQLPRPTVVFAERTRRSESLGFRLGYFFYRVFHYVLIGRGISVGNFSVISASLLPALTLDPLLWNHYAAAVIRAQFPKVLLPTERGKRIQGRSRLNWVGLVVHGLSALACYSEIIGVRLIFASGLLLFLAFLSSMVLIWIRFFTTAAVPGWTSVLLCLITVLILQIATLVANFTMQIVSGRSLQPFLPARDYSWFVASFRACS